MPTNRHIDLHDADSTATEKCFMNANINSLYTLTCILHIWLCVSLSLFLSGMSPPHLQRDSVHPVPRQAGDGQPGRDGRTYPSTCGPVPVLLHHHHLLHSGLPPDVVPQWRLHRPGVWERGRGRVRQLRQNRHDVYMADVLQVVAGPAGVVLV